MSRESIIGAKSKQSSLLNSIGSFRQAVTNLELGDVLIFLYFLVFVRQCFWPIENNSLAWVLTGFITIVVWAIYLSTRQFAATRYGSSFWLLVGIPLFVAFLMRAAFPERSFDVLTYHLLQAERSLRGPLYQAGDFFHSVPFNPAPDTLTGISRLVLGFRLGTAINLAVLIWTAQITDKILRSFVNNKWLRAASVLLVVLTENVLFEISTYMVDLLMLPLLLQATLLTIRDEEAENRSLNFAHIALLLGASAALKLTTLSVGLPLLAVCGYKMALGANKLRLKQIVSTTLLMLVSFLAPLVPFSIYIFRLTGNPIFPVANTFFESPYWPTHGGWDNRWGPQSIFETLVWPVLIWFKPERHSELGVYSGRLSLGFIVSLVGLILAWRNARVRLLCFILISTSLFWSRTALGYSRYGLFQDLLAGLVVVVVAAVLVPKDSWRKVSWQTCIASLLFVVLIIQSLFASAYALRVEWGERTTLIADPYIYAQEAKWMFRDRSLTSFLTDEERARFDKVQVWLQSAQKTTGFEVLLNARAPVIAVHQPEFFVTRQAWREFINKIKATTQEGMYSLCLAADLPNARKVIEARGLEVGEVTAVNLPFFSLRDPISMMFIEVRVPQDRQAREQFETAWMKAAFPVDDYRQHIVPINPPSEMHSGEKLDIRFKVKNLGSVTWPAVGTKDFRYQINMGNHWILDGVASEDSRAVMSGDLPPGAETDITLAVKAPAVPGDYILEIDMVHEGVTWFKERGAEPLALRVRVRP